MRVFNIYLLAFITLISSANAASSGSMPKSLQSKGTSTSSTQSSSSSSTSGSSSGSTSSSMPKMSSSSESFKTTGMPKISATASPNSNSTSSSSSYTVTFTPIVPTASNPEIHIETLPSGTTFIAVGSVLGLVFSVLILTRLIMSCVSSRRARKGNMMQNQQQEFDYDPTLFQEKDLKKHTSRASIYSLGSTSTLNVLGSQASMEQMIAPSGRSLRTALMNNNSRASMFISPTEMLVNQHLYSRSQEDHGYSSYDSPIESPSTAAYTTPSLEPARNDQRRPSRPPSVFMEQLFDDEQSINSYEYDSDAHNKV